MFAFLSKLDVDSHFYSRLWKDFNLRLQHVTAHIGAQVKRCSSYKQEASCKPQEILLASFECVRATVCPITFDVLKKGPPLP